MNEISEPLQTDRVSIPQPQLGEARPFNQWLFDTIRPFVTGKIVETASGRGNTAGFFVEQGIPLYLSDPSTATCQALSKQYQEETMIKGIFSFDLNHPDFDHVYNGILGRVDTVLVLNNNLSLHLNSLVLANARSLLRPRGRLVLCIPASTALYDGLDQGFDRWRSDNYKSTRRTIGKGFEIIALRYFHLVEIVGWSLFECIVQSRERLQGQPSLYDDHVALFRMVDAITAYQPGLYIIVIARKNKV